eukprot:scaffold341_cov154-Ochromonas_danica.AAC.18
MGKFVMYYRRVDNSIRRDSMMSENSTAYLHVLVQANNATIDRDKRDEAERAVNVTSEEDVVGVHGFLLSLWTAHIDFIHTLHHLEAVVLLAKESAKHLDDLRSVGHSVKSMSGSVGQVRVPPVRRGGLRRILRHGPLTDFSQVALARLMSFARLVIDGRQIRRAREEAESVFRVEAVAAQRAAEQWQQKPAKDVELHERGGKRSSQQRSHGGGHEKVWQRGMHTEGNQVVAVLQEAQQPVDGML